MTKVDFYILSQEPESARLILACRLTEKAWRLDHSIYLHTRDEAHCQQAEEQLWRFSADAFLPRPHPRLQVGYGDNPGEHQGVLINIALKVPAFFSRFERVAELVCQQADVLAASRENWKFYQHRGYPLQSHRL